MIVLAAALVASAMIGVGAEWRAGAGARRSAEVLLRIVLWVVLPFVGFVNINALELTAEVGAGLGFAWVAALATVGLAYLLGSRVLHLSRAATGGLMLVAGIANTGYLGVPFTAALFGSDHIPDAITYDVLVNAILSVTVGFAIGAGFGTAAEGVRERMIVFFVRNPPLWATVLAFVAPHALAPEWMLDATHVVVLAVVPIGFYAVGVSLASEAEEGAAVFPPPLSAPVVSGVVLKLLVPPAIVLALSTAIIDIPDVYVTQAAMATGLTSLAIAHEFGLDRALVAAVIAWTTTLVLVAGLVASAV
ncbi:MAG: AEC family transporter [Thermoleophilaceae bacterium]